MSYVQNVDRTVLVRVRLELCPHGARKSSLGVNGAVGGRDPVRAKYLGVAYLLFMAVSTVRDHRVLTVDATAPRSAARVIASGVLVNLLNPKLTIFFFAFLPQFVERGGHTTVRMLGLSAVFMLVTFVVFAAYGIFAAAVRDQVISRPRVMAWTRRVFGGAFAALAGRLALAQR